MHIFIVSTFFVCLCSKIFACPTNGYVNNGICYIPFSNLSNWYLAETQCVQNGGHLASIPNAFTNAFLSSVAISEFGSTNFWVGGLADTRQNVSSWEWIDYANFSYINWGPDEPLKSDSTMCMIQNPDNAKWYSAICNTTRPYICELTNSSQLCMDPTWVHLTAFGGEKCIGFFDMTTTWPEAVGICEEFGGNIPGHESALTSIHSVKENLIYYYYNNYFIGDEAWIGLFDQDPKVENNYTWIDRTPLDYNNLASSGGQCGYLDDEDNYFWYTDDCTRNLYGFICKVLL